MKEKGFAPIIIIVAIVVIIFAGAIISMKYLPSKLPNTSLTVSTSSTITNKSKYAVPTQTPTAINDPKKMF